ncbi:hypothetical protein L0F63_001018 [Massospora cicadina]|nr:hypothetical protein L0F63_001018 [Massospora cicadina]
MAQVDLLLQLSDLAHMVDERWRYSGLSPPPSSTLIKLIEGTCQEIMQARGHGLAPGTPHSPGETYQNFEETAIIQSLDPTKRWWIISMVNCLILNDKVNSPSIFVYPTNVNPSICFAVRFSESAPPLEQPQGIPALMPAGSAPTPGLSAANPTHLRAPEYPDQGGLSPNAHRGSIFPSDSTPTTRWALCRPSLARRLSYL